METGRQNNWEEILMRKGIMCNGKWNYWQNGKWKWEMHQGQWKLEHGSGYKILG